MELGGNAPFIVFEDADIEQAVQGALASKYRNAGQTCICTNRIFVHQDIADTFTEKYVSAVTELKLGKGIDAGTNVGPMISAAAVSKTHDLVQQAVAQGAKLACGGNLSPLGESFYPPTVLTEVDNTMAVAQQELFAPVSPIIQFNNEAQVVAMANDTPYGLAAYFYSRDISRIWRVAEKLQFGMVGINDTAISNTAAPFGGMKQSGYGREGSKYGLDDYLDIKYLSFAL